MMDIPQPRELGALSIVDPLLEEHLPDCQIVIKKGQTPGRTEFRGIECSCGLAARRRQRGRERDEWL